MKLQAEDHVLIDRAPLKQMIALQHVTDCDRIIITAVRQASAPIEQRALLRRKQSGDNGQQGGFADSVIVETFERQLVIKIKIFTGKVYLESFDMERICNRLHYALIQKNVSANQAAKDIGVSRYLMSDYINYKYSEDSMQVETLIKFAEYFGEERYYFCNEYHRFLDSVDAGKLLRELRSEHNMTQREFAAYLEISHFRYKSYEEGRCKVSRELFDTLKSKVNLKL